MSDQTPEVMPFETAAEAAAQLNGSEATVRSAQAARKARGEAYAEAKAIFKREYRKALLEHRDVSPAPVREAMAEDTALDETVRQEVAKVAQAAGIHRADFYTVGDVEFLMDLAKEARDGAKDAVQVWERWGSQWQSIVSWCKDDAAREMGGSRRPPMQAIEGGRR